jgi:hypothetical protein
MPDARGNLKDGLLCRGNFSIDLRPGVKPGELISDADVLEAIVSFPNSSGGSVLAVGNGSIYQVLDGGVVGLQFFIYCEGQTRSVFFPGDKVSRVRIENSQIWPSTPK